MTGRAHIIGAIAGAAAGLAAGWVMHGGTTGDGAHDPGPDAKSDQRATRSSRPEAPAGIATRIGRVARLGNTGDRMKAAYAMAMAVPLDQIAAWLDGDYFDTADSRVDAFFCQILYDRWLDADPEAFLSRCLHKNYERDLTARYMKEWARRDPGAARDFMLGLSDRKDLHAVAGVVLGQLAETDPAGTIALIGELIRDRGVTGSHLGNAMDALAKSDPDGLLAASAGWPTTVEEHALRRVGAVKLSQDFMGGIEWMLDHRGDTGRHLLNEAMSGNEKLAKEFFRFADRLPEGWAKSVIDQESWSLSRADPEACLAMDAERFGLTPEDLNNLRSNALQRLTENDWDQAATMLAGDPGLSEAERRTLAECLAQGLASKSLEDARAWAATLADPALRASADAQLESRAEPGVDSPTTLTPTTLVANALNEHGGDSPYEARYWSQRETAQAVDAFRALSQEDRTKAANSLLRHSHYVPYDLQAAMIGHQLDSPPAPAEESRNHDPFQNPGNPENPATGLVRQWASWDPAAAARWVESLPPGPSRESASRQLLDSWHLQAPAEAQRWADRLPADAGWDGIRNDGPDHDP